MNVSAIQMNVDFANATKNLTAAEQWVQKAAIAGSDLVLLPEFFTSAIGFADAMLSVAYDNRKVDSLMRAWAKGYEIIVAGSYIRFDGKDAHNVFMLCFPTGEVYEHNKDIPTQFENCYYTEGDTQHIFETPIGSIGVALCWEMIRYDTLQRLSGNVDLVLAGSCWWDLPEDAPADRQPLREYNQQLAAQAPARFAELLQVPVVHANHCGKVAAWNFPHADKLQTRQLVGAAQIVSGQGEVLACLPFSDGEGLISAKLTLDGNNRRKSDFGADYWIPGLPDAYINAWNTTNPVGAKYYHETALPRYKEMFRHLIEKK